MRYILSLLALLLSFTAVAQEEVQSIESQKVQQEQGVAVEAGNMTLWEAGNQAYIDGDFEAAVAAYHSIENRG